MKISNENFSNHKKFSNHKSQNVLFLSCCKNYKLLYHNTKNLGISFSQSSFAYTTLNGHEKEEKTFKSISIAENILPHNFWAKKLIFAKKSKIHHNPRKLFRK